MLELIELLKNIILKNKTMCDKNFCCYRHLDVNHKKGVWAKIRPKLGSEIITPKLDADIQNERKEKRTTSSLLLNGQSGKFVVECH